MNVEEHRASVEFTPAPLVPRRRRLDPVVVGVVIVLVGLAVAIVKPWDTTSQRVAPSEAVVPIASVEALPAPTAPTPPPADSTDAVGRFLAALGTHDAWGVRTVDLTPEPAERWVPATPSAGAGPTVAMGTIDEPIVTLGVTAPLDQTPLAIRIWRSTADGAPEWIDAHLVDPAIARGALLLELPSTDGSLRRPWPSGRYRIELLTGTRIDHLDVSIASRFELVPGLPAASPPPEELVSAAGIVPTGIGTGLFTVADGAATSLSPPLPGPPLDAAGVWLDAGLLHGPGASPQVSSAWAPRATGIGVAMPPGRRLRTADLRRLGPGAIEQSPSPVIGVAPSGAVARSYGLFPSPAGQAWSPGFYAIDTVSTDGTREYHDSWHLELRPGPESVATDLLVAARRYVPFAGRETITVGADTEVPEIFGGTSCEHLQPPVNPTVLGISYPVSTTVADSSGGSRFKVSIESIFGGSHVVEVPLRVAPEVVPGLAVVAPADGGAFAAGPYRLTVGIGGVDHRSEICLGELPYNN